MGYSEWELLARLQPLFWIGTRQDVCFCPLLWHISRLLAEGTPLLVILLIHGVLHDQEGNHYLWLKLWLLSLPAGGLFPGGETLSWFLAFLKITIEFLSDVLNFLLAVLVLITWETNFWGFLPEHTCFIFGLMSWGVIGCRSTDLVVLAPMIATGHGVVDGSQQARFSGGVEYPDCLFRVGVLAGFIVSVKTDPLAL